MIPKKHKVILKEEESKAIIVPEDQKVTAQEVENSMEFKILMKTLKLKFPFIKGYKFDNINEYSLIFFDLVIDITYIADKYKLQIADFIKYLVRRNLPTKGVSLTYFFQPINDEQDDLLRNMCRDIEKTCKSIHETRVIPKNLKLPRRLDVISYFPDLKDMSHPQLMEPIK